MQGELDRITEQIGQDLLQTQWVAAEELVGRCRVIQMQLQAFAFGRQALRREHLLAQLTQGKIQLFQLDGTTVELGRVEDVIEQAQQRTRRMLQGTQMATLFTGKRRFQQQVGKADDGIHRRTNFMAHVGQEAAARGSGGFGAITGSPQILFHDAARGQVGRQLDDLERLAVGIEDRVVAGLNPDFPPALTKALVFTCTKMTCAQIHPALAISIACHQFRIAEHTVVAPYHLLLVITIQRQCIVVDVEDIAVEVELDQCHRLADRGVLAFVFGIAPLGFGLVEQHAIDPTRHTVFVANCATTFPDPVFRAIAVEQAVFDGVVAALLDSLHHLGGDSLIVVRVIHIGNRTAATDEILRTPTGEGLHRIADKYHGPVLIQRAAERHTRNVADQRTVLLLAVTQGLLHGLSFADIGDEYHEQRTTA